jgi:hypothetical protein
VLKAVFHIIMRRISCGNVDFMADSRARGRFFRRLMHARLWAHARATDHPAVALFRAQLVGWTIKPEGYTAFGSGPASATSHSVQNYSILNDCFNTSGLSFPDL